MRNLFSTNWAICPGFSILMDAEGCLIKDKEGGIVARGVHWGDLTELHNITQIFGRALLTETEVWHHRLGHPSDECLETISKNSTGMPALSNVHITCNACSEGKQTRKPISKEPAKEPEVLLSQVYGDLLGPVPVTSLGGAKYINRIIDAKTRHTWVYFQKSKNKTAEQLDSWITRLNNNTEDTVKVFFTDNGKEYTGNATQKVFTKHRVIHQTTTPNTPEYNRLIEKKFHLIVQTTRTLLHQSGLPQFLWAEAVCLATYLINRQPTKHLRNISPYKVWTEHPPDLSNLHIFRAKGQVLVEGRHLSKFEKHTTIMAYLGPALTNQGHKMWNSTTH